ncbi:hypothetical protein DLM75_12260 [Leptospira stimsonii]|uniref:Uncharacterized protein n=1 Tax=Leptospira stimsonii TaxID=2202203 RepID=A0A396Z9C6_9LEPT|nr:hypothetical protein DLM75_12260 [Leptospira stimsonii]
MFLLDVVRRNNKTNFSAFLRRSFSSFLLKTTEFDDSFRFSEFFTFFPKQIVRSLILRSRESQNPFLFEFRTDFSFYILKRAVLLSFAIGPISLR